MDFIIISYSNNVRFKFDLTISFADIRVLPRFSQIRLASSKTFRRLSYSLLRGISVRTISESPS